MLKKKSVITILSLVVFLLSVSTANAEKFRAQWHVVGTNMVTGWNYGTTDEGAYCGHGDNCNCYTIGEETCGKYQNGDITKWWPKGCSAPSQTIQCEAEIVN